MALSPKDLSDLVSRLMPEAMGDDPEESLRPGTTARGPTAMALSRGRSRSQAAVPVFAVRGSDTPAPGRSAGPGPAGYGLLELVGEGGFGEVWEAIQMSLGRIVAVKRMSDKLIAELAKDPGEMAKVEEDFQREALTTALLEHPNIVPVHDLGLDEDGRPLLAMKMVRGERWDEQLYDDLVKLTADEVLAHHLPILIDVAQAVAFAHSRGIVHRDIKPSQVMVGEFGETLLMDWGIAVLYNPGLLDEDCRQLVDEIAPTPDKAFNPTGTPAYMAPEQTTSSALQIGPWTDVYLLGGILYYLLTGRSPHSAPTSKESFALAAKGHVHPPQEMAPGREMPRELVEIALKALAPKPSDRFGSVKDFIHALENYMTGAGNRQRSMAITKDVAGQVAAGLNGYEVLTDCHNRLLQAVSLWPQNPMVESLQTQVRLAYAGEALRNGDLVLARLMAEAVGEVNADERDRLLAEIATREKRDRGSRRQRRILYIVALVLVLLVMFDIIFLIAWQRSEGMTAMRRRVDDAERRAAVAERRLGEFKAAGYDVPEEAPVEPEEGNPE